MKNMKQILTITALALISSGVFAQDDQASKHVRFGLVVSPSVNWLKSGEKLIEKKGVSMNFGGGLGLEFRLTDVAVFATGLMINTSGGKVKYRNDLTGNPSSSFVTFFYDKENDEIVEFTPAYDAFTTTSAGQDRYDLCLINERKYTITYVTLPLTLKLRTKEIGSLKYFGMFGVNSSFRVAAKATDEVQKLSTTTGNWLSPETISKSDIKKDVNLFNEALNMGLGVEWNLSGSTSLVIGANYLLGFTNVVKKESDYLNKYTESGPAYGTSLKQSLKANSIALTVGILF
jgi:hypothetical protein